MILKRALLHEVKAMIFYLCNKSFKVIDDYLRMANLLLMAFPKTIHFFHLIKVQQIAG